ENRYAYRTLLSLPDSDRCGDQCVFICDVVSGRRSMGELSGCRSSANGGRQAQSLGRGPKNARRQARFFWSLAARRSEILSEPRGGADTAKRPHTSIRGRTATANRDS